ncbi:hypothetical protein ACPA9J_14420 [Pseudomonas aeruginosa]
MLDAAIAEDTFERHRLEAFERSLPPAEAIAERAGPRYADAQVMINVIDQPFRSAGFIHRPTLKSRLPLTPDPGPARRRRLGRQPGQPLRPRTDPGAGGGRGRALRPC